MKVVGLDGRTYQWKLHGKTTHLNDISNRSSGHVRCRQFLTKLFPCEVQLEEVLLPGSGGLRADFFLPAKELIVEVHGRQHYEFVLMFHQTRRGFLEAQKRDRQKREWCERNELIYCELPDSEDFKQWQSRVKDATQFQGECDED